MISPNLIDKFTTLLFDDINNADDGTLIVYFVAEFMKSFYKPYCETLELDDIAKRNFYFDFYSNELLNFLVDYDDSEYISVEFKKGSFILSDYYTHTELLNSALKNTAEGVCKKYRDGKSEDEWDECFRRKYATAFRAFLFNLGDEVYNLFKRELEKIVLKYLSDLKILLENYSSDTVNKGIEYNDLNLFDVYQNFVINKKLDSNLFRIIEKNFDNKQLYVLFNPEIIGLDFVLRKIHLDYKENRNNQSKMFYINDYIHFLLKNVCSLEELIKAEPSKEGEVLLFGLAGLDNNSKFIGSSRPEDVDFFVKSTRNLLFGFENINLEDLATAKIIDSPEESELSVLLNNISIGFCGSTNSDLSKEIVKNFLIEDPICKDDIDQLVKLLSKIQLLIWQNKVILPEIVSEKFELALLGIDTFLKYAEVTDNINKEIYYYFTNKFIRSVDRKYIKDLKDTIRTITYKMILDTEVDEIPVSLKLLSCFSSTPIEKNLLISNTFVPRDKKIILYDLSGLCFDDNLMIALSEINTYFNIDQCDLNVSYDKNESKSWELLFNCIRSGHLDFNPHIEMAESNLISLNIAPTK